MSNTASNPEAKSPKLPPLLKGIRVLDIAPQYSGANAAAILADFGAEVISIEHPDGSPIRTMLPTKEGDSAWWKVAQRNITLDLSKPKGREIFLKFAREHDVLVENFRPGTLEKWKIGPADLEAEGISLALLRISGYGQTGPMRDNPGFGTIAEAMSGFAYMNGFPDGPPAFPSTTLGDGVASIFGAAGVLAALVGRLRSGGLEKNHGVEVIDVALFESVLAVMENLITEFDITGYVRERSGSVLPGIAPSNAYPCAGGDMILIGGNGDNVYARLTEAMGRPDLKIDPKFVDHASRGVNQAELDGIIAVWTSGYLLEDLLILLQGQGVPASRVFRAPDMLEDPQFQAREAIVSVDHPVFGAIRMQNAFPKLSATPGRVRWPGPKLGEHTDEVLTDRAGCDTAQLAALRADGII